MSVDVILGLQWGDEGKGKIVDLLAKDYDIVARFQGGPNAGHTIHFDDKKIILHTIPSGISSPRTQNVIGNGVLIDPLIFQKEINMLEHVGINPQTNLFISRRAHLITPSHRLLDAALEQYRGASKIGSTLKGIGPAYTDKVARQGLRIGDIEAGNYIEKLHKLKDDHFRMIHSLGLDPFTFEIENMKFSEYADLWLNAAEYLKTFNLIDSEIFLNKAISQQKRILAEGAQGTLLDIDFGSYPFVTSSNTTIGGVCTGLGIPPASISKVFGIFKAYCTRVGSGPFPTELHNEDGNLLRKSGNEFGSTTGRPRRCGWIDLPALRYSMMINGITDLVITKSDVLNCFETIHVCKSYLIDGKPSEFPPFDTCTVKIDPVLELVSSWNEQISQINDWTSLPSTFKNYIHILESELNCKISIISTGPHRNQTIFRNNN
jgi:adenylosuccinate synthase